MAKTYLSKSLISYLLSNKIYYLLHIPYALLDWINRVGYPFVPYS